MHPSIDSFITNGKVDVPAVMDIAIPLSQQSRVPVESLSAIRASLAGNEIARRHIGAFLQFANQMLADAEAALTASGHRRQYGDRAFAEVGYGGKTFIFRRI